MTSPLRVVLLIGAALALLLTSCNTMSGFGQDLQRAGAGLENTGQGRTW